MTPKTFTLSTVCAVAMAALLGPGEHSATQEQENIRKQPACTIFCGDGTFNTISLGAKPCWGGPLPADGAGDHFKSLAEQGQAAICQNLAAANKSKESCPAFKTLGQLCKARSPQTQPPEKKKDDCEKPTPWFGSSSDCKDVQSPVVDVRMTTLVELSFCGDPVFRHIVPADYLGGVNAYVVRLKYFVTKRVGSKICCDKWREAVRTGTPCNPSEDIDCDGKLNTADFYTPNLSPAPLPDINNLFASPEGAPIDPFPTGLNPDDADFVPPQDKCDCKWVLVKGTLTCSPDGKERHVYQAHWRCPSTGNERFTRKYANATEPCP